MSRLPLLQFHGRADTMMPPDLRAAASDQRAHFADAPDSCTVSEDGWSLAVWVVVRVLHGGVSHGEALQIVRGAS